MIAGLPLSVDLLALRRRVQEKLCEIGMLEIDQFPLTERNVIKSGQTCGVYF